jgi:hypothetical protein
MAIRVNDVALEHHFDGHSTARFVGVQRCGPHLRRYFCECPGSRHPTDSRWSDDALYPRKRTCDWRSSICLISGASSVGSTTTNCHQGP